MRDEYDEPGVVYVRIYTFVICAYDPYSIPEFSSYVELWMISEYHPHGSLFDYLTIHVLTPEQVVRFARTIASGLAFLHSDLRTNETQKPSIAHRDLKSRNILVKADMTCCIADFGLAVRHDTVQHLIDIAPNSKQGVSVTAGLCPALVTGSRALSIAVLIEQHTTHLSTYVRDCHSYFILHHFWYIMSHLACGGYITDYIVCGL